MAVPWRLLFSVTADTPDGSLTCAVIVTTVGPHPDAAYQIGSADSLMLVIVGGDVSAVGAGGGGAETVTVAVRVDVDPPQRAVKVYVVVVPGVTFLEPGVPTPPMP